MISYKTNKQEMKIFQNLNRMFILPGTCPVYVQKSPNLCVWCKEPAWTWTKTCEEWTLTPSLLWRKREHGVRRYGCQQTRLNSVLWVRECICSVVGERSKMHFWTTFAWSDVWSYDLVFHRQRSNCARKFRSLLSFRTSMTVKELILWSSE